MRLEKEAETRERGKGDPRAGGYAPLGVPECSNRQPRQDEDQHQMLALPELVQWREHQQKRRGCPGGVGDPPPLRRDAVQDRRGENDRDRREEEYAEQE
jgi:hypothetical protein